MADTPETVGIATLIAAAVAAAVEVLRPRSKKTIDVEDAVPEETPQRVSTPIHALSAQIGGLSQRFHDVEARMTRIELTHKEVVEAVHDMERTVSGLHLKYERSSAEMKKDIEHLGGRVREILSRLEKE